jgi:hypothetical protein
MVGISHLMRLAYITFATIAACSGQRDKASRIVRTIMLRITIAGAMENAERDSKPLQKRLVDGKILSEDFNE